MANGNGNGSKNNTTAEGGAQATAIQDAPKTSVPAPVVPSTGMTPMLATGGLLALGGAAIYGLHRWRQSRALAEGKGAPLPGGSAPTQGTSQGPPPASQGGSPPASQGGAKNPPAGPAAIDPNFWGTSTRGAEYRQLLAKIEEVSRMPVRLFFSVVANRESGWNRRARNKTKVETAASGRAIEAGPERGNPPPKFASSLAAAGSGGLFGALAPYVAWTGLDEGFMPYLDEDYTIVEDAIVAAICAAKYYQRIVTFYPTVFASATPTPEDNYRVRLGWASPKELKEDPGGSLFKAVQGRMDEDLAALGLKISDLPPPSAERWPGLAAVVEGMKGLTPTWK